MSLIAQLAELESRKRQLLDGALAEIQALVDALNEAGYTYRLVSSESDTVATAVSWSHTIANALTDAEKSHGKKSSGLEQADAANVLNSRIASLDDNDLWNALNYFYPRFHNLVSGVAQVTGMSIGHVQRVLVRERRSPEVRTEIVKEFRRRMRTKDASK